MPTTWSRATRVVLAITLAAPLSAAAQSPTGARPGSVTLPPPASGSAGVERGRAVRWWEVASVVGGVAAALASDAHLLDELRDHASAEAGSAATVFRQAGDGKAYVGLAAAVVGAGLVDGEGEITRMGAQLVASGAVATLSVGILKGVTGRSRPHAGRGAYDFRPFSGSRSFPSGHTACAFAVATTLADALDEPWVSVGLYAVATGTAWSRIYDGRHWPSDVLLGAAVGTASARLMNGRWRLFGIRPPRLLLGRGTVGLEAAVAF